MEISQLRIFASADFRYCEISLQWMRNFAKMTEKFRLTWRKFASALTKFRGEISSNFCEIKERKTPNFVCISFAQYCTSIENYFFIVLLIIFWRYREFIFGPTMPCGPCSWSGLIWVFDFLGRPFWKLWSGGVLSKRMPRRNIVRERNERGFHLSYKICKEPVVCALVMRFSGPRRLRSDFTTRTQF